MELRELAFAGRTLRKSPIVALTAALTVAQDVEFVSRPLFDRHGTALGFEQDLPIRTQFNLSITSHGRSTEQQNT